MHWPNILDGTGGGPWGPGGNSGDHVAFPLDATPLSGYREVERLTPLVWYLEVRQLCCRQCVHATPWVWPGLGCISTLLTAEPLSPPWSNYLARLGPCVRSEGQPWLLLPSRSATAREAPSLSVCSEPKSALGVCTAFRGAVCAVPRQWLYQPPSLQEEERTCASWRQGPGREVPTRPGTGPVPCALLPNPLVSVVTQATSWAPRSHSTGAGILALHSTQALSPAGVSIAGPAVCL